MTSIPKTKDGEVTNPFSTGGGGSVFELKVDAGLLSLLLVGGQIPAVEDVRFGELHLQAEHLGYKTDDAVVIGSDRIGNQHKQLWSVKHEVKLTESNVVFQEVIADAWEDFLASERFDQNLDMIVLATAPLPRTARHLITILELARASDSSTSFYTRVGREGFASQKGKSYVNLIQKLCNDAAKHPVSPEQLWAFLRCFHILSFDFDQTASLDEARFKTLLSMALRRQSGSTGSELWNAIFKWVADRNPRAGSFTPDSLPLEWRQLSAEVGAYFESGAIQRLKDHTADLLKRIKTSLGPNLHLERQELTDQLGESFLGQGFALVTGEAGVGKSAAVLSALWKILNGAPLFVFQASEFAKDNLDHAFADLRVNEPLSTISALFALQPRKFLMIESVERLLESYHRDAFFSLLDKLKQDPTWCIVLTCRQHAVSMVKEAFLGPLSINVVESAVPILSEAELDEVAQVVPGIQSVVTNTRTRQLLRNPWFLDKACSVNWTDESPNEPLDEKRLRDVIWRQVVMREDVRLQGIHLQRDRSFRDIALRRARSLQSFVPVHPGEELAVQALVADELLVEEPHSNWVAPAHDVLEDWALVRWIHGQFRSNGADPKIFFITLGHELPIRRSFRQWLGEMLLSGELEKIRLFVERSLANSDIEPYWQDETIVSILLSEHASTFIEERAAELLKDDKEGLKRLIHLLRVACKKPNPFLKLSEVELAKSFGDTHLIPKGNAWPSVIRVLHQNLAKLAIEDLPLVLGLLEDWKSAINWQNPTPEAAREAGLIALDYWRRLDGRRWKEEIKRLASILLACPQAIAIEFEDLLQPTGRSVDYRDRAEILEKKLFASLEGSPACRFLPELVSKFAESHWGIDKPIPKNSGNEWSHHMDMEDHFGLDLSHLEYFPASALHGPFFSLLQWNPDAGMKLILKLVNVSTERFVQLGLDREYDPPNEITVDVGDGLSRKQWMNERLWSMYREGMPAPNVVACALMALERWLLDCASSGWDLQSISRNLLFQSNSVAITAVVASVAMAYPEQIGSTALAVLRTKEFFDLDIKRYVKDRSSLNSLFGGELGFDSYQRMYKDERIESAKLPHRSQNLETLCCTLQTGKLRNNVWQILDSYKEALPPQDKQTDQDKLWRLRLHRMDLRNFTSQEALADGRVVLRAAPAEPDLREVVDRDAPMIKAFEEGCNLLNWGMSLFERNDDTYDSKQWRQMLTRAKERLRVPRLGNYLYDGGPAYVVAVCVRDHWAELTTEEKIWCRDYLLSLINQDDQRDGPLRDQEFEMAGSRAAARVLPLLLDDADEESRTKVRRAIAIAVTHAIEEVRKYAAGAVGLFLWERDQDLASACIAGLLDLAQLERVSYGKWRRQSQYSVRSVDELVSMQISTIRERIELGVPLPGRGPYRFSIVDPFSARVLPLIADILSVQQSNTLAHLLWDQIVRSLIRSWAPKSDRREMQEYEVESALSRQFSDFIVRCDRAVSLKLWKPLTGVIDDHGRKVAEVFKWLIYAEDIAKAGEAFWAIWENTADGLLRTPNYQQRLRTEHDGLINLGSALLLDDVYWNKDAKDWPPLHGHEREIERFFMIVGATPKLCKSFVRILDSVGNSLLPKALWWLDDRLQAGEPSQMIGDRNTLFSLARILSPLVFGQTEVLRQSPDMRDATIRILDAMVQQGSSAAYRMREFLITPISPKRQTMTSSH